MSDKKNIPQPKTKGVVKVPVVMQLEVLECGAASLTMIMHYYRKFIPLEQARVDCGVSRDGANAKNIILAARSYGMEAKAWRVDPEDLIAEGPFPCIIHWGFNHFVVLCGFHRGKAVLNDPARGRVDGQTQDRLFLCKRAAGRHIVGCDLRSAYDDDLVSDGNYQCCFQQGLSGPSAERQ